MRVFKILKILFLLLLTLLNTSCVANTYYFKSKNELVLACGPKKLFSKPLFRSLVIECLGSSVRKEYPNLFIKVDNHPIVNLSSLDEKNLQKVDGVKVKKDSHYDDKETLYKMHDAVSLFIDQKNGEIIRVSISAWKDEKVEIGFKKEKMLRFPLSKKDVISLFGEGKIYSVFNH